MCAHVCVWVQAKERGRGGERETHDTPIVQLIYCYVCVCVCVYVCVCERERDQYVCIYCDIRHIRARTTVSVE